MTRGSAGTPKRWRSLIGGPKPNKDRPAGQPASDGVESSAAVEANPILEPPPAPPAPPAIPDAPPKPTFAVERCELVGVDGGDALLRVGGRWQPTAPGNVELLLWTSTTIASIAPLPPGPTRGADGSWGTAFALEASAVKSATKLLLFAGAGVSIELPAPAQRLEPNRRNEPNAEDLLAELEEARTIGDQLRRRCELAERGLAEVRDKIVHAWGEAASLRVLLDEREEAHTLARETARVASETVDGLEHRAARAEAELAERRGELEAQCARLGAELEQKTHDATAVQAEAGEALARFEAARGEAETLTAQLAEAREHADAAAAEAARAAEELAAEQTRADAASTTGDAHRERAERAEQLLDETRERLAEAEMAAAELATAEQTLREQLDRMAHDTTASQAGAADVLARYEAARGEAEAMATELADARERADAAAAEAARAAEELVAERTRADAASTTGDAHRERAERAEQLLEETREQLAAAQSAASELATGEQAARQQLESLTRTDLEPEEAKGIGRGKRVSARAYKEALAKLEAEETERTRLEDETARLADQVRRLENELAEATAATVETDLRHLLEARERELAGVRAELAEQRARFASVASQLPVPEALPAPKPAPAAPAASAASEPWSAVDQDLLDRIARAKQLAGED